MKYYKQEAETQDGQKIWLIQEDAKITWVMCECYLESHADLILLALNNMITVREAS